MIKNKDKIIYLAGAYNHPDPAVREARAQAHAEITARLTLEGWIIYSPICHSHSLAVEHGLRGDWDFWERIDRAMIAKCDEFCIFTIPGWRTSTGTTAETAWARELKLPIRWVCEGGEPTDYLVEVLPEAAVEVDKDHPGPGVWMKTPDPDKLLDEWMKERMAA